jgi:hypothetical protein
MARLLVCIADLCGGRIALVLFLQGLLFLSAYLRLLVLGNTLPVATIKHPMVHSWCSQVARPTLRDCQQKWNQQ